MAEQPLRQAGGSCRPQGQHVRTVEDSVSGRRSEFEPLGYSHDMCRRVFGGGEGGWPHDSHVCAVDGSVLGGRASFELQSRADVVWTCEPFGETEEGFRRHNGNMRAGEERRKDGCHTLDTLCHSLRVSRCSLSHNSFSVGRVTKVVSHYFEKMIQLTRSWILVRGSSQIGEQVATCWVLLIMCASVRECSGSLRVLPASARPASFGRVGLNVLDWNVHSFLGGGGLKMDGGGGAILRESTELLSDGENKNCRKMEGWGGITQWASSELLLEGRGWGCLRPEGKEDNARGACSGLSPGVGASGGVRFQEELGATCVFEEEGGCLGLRGGGVRPPANGPKKVRKSKSKRKTLKLKYKIQKRVTQHYRKLRRVKSKEDRGIKDKRAKGLVGQKPKTSFKDEMAWIMKSNQERLNGKMKVDKTGVGSWNAGRK